MSAAPSARVAGLWVLAALALLPGCACPAAEAGPSREPTAEAGLSRGAAAVCASSYDRYACRSCHGETGRDAADLRHAAAHLHSDREIEEWIRHPSHVRPGTAMPDYDGVILEADYPSLVQCVRALGTDAP